MKIIRSNFESLLRYALEKRAAEEYRRTGNPSWKSAERAAWEEYLREVEEGAQLIEITGNESRSSQA